ncbi:hypothetical protein AGDE_17158 [Angomonas deanei]|uniref:Uncharacterized protein n=1 Tax=Angomonas deanei TaxID=59799 RepID=A0A7G2CQ43_9TRYP|nr:hypothetical protein AGDE_17158 [Angomonas deanei]CAD2221469.1 hypothetical protein, conserved [Angomonas deanei]|eukprot:EPY15138.1 hypothetical protein AGDE_17158 [Angomonas deanei]
MAITVESTKDALQQEQEKLSKMDHLRQENVSLMAYSQKLLERSEELVALLEEKTQLCDVSVSNYNALRRSLEEECLKSVTLEGEKKGLLAEVASLTSQLEETAEQYAEKLLDVEYEADRKAAWRKVADRRLAQLKELLADYKMSVESIVEALRYTLQVDAKKENSSALVLSHVEAALTRADALRTNLNTIAVKDDDDENDSNPAATAGDDNLEHFSQETAAALTEYRESLLTISEMQVRMAQQKAAIDVLAERGYDMDEAWKRIENDIRVETEANRRHQEHRDLLLFELESANKARERAEEARREADERATLLESDLQVMRLQQGDAASGPSSEEVEQLRSRYAQLSADYETAMNRLQLLERSGVERAGDLYQQLLETEARCQVIQRELDLYKDNDVARRAALAKSNTLAKYEEMRYSDTLHTNLDKVQSLRATFGASDAKPSGTDPLSKLQDALQRNLQLEQEQIEWRSRYERVEEKLHAIEEENNRLSRLSGVVERLSTSQRAPTLTRSMPPPSTPSFVHMGLSPVPTPGPLAAPSPLPQQPLFSNRDVSSSDEDEEEEEQTSRRSSRSFKSPQSRKRTRSASSKR